MTLHLEGHQFGRLTVLRADGKGPHKQRYWLLECRCGALYRMSGTVLMRGAFTGRNCAGCGTVRGRVPRRLVLGKMPAVGWFPGVAKPTDAN